MFLSNRNEQGSTLIIVLVSVAVLMLLGGTFLTHTLTEARVAVNHRNNTQAYFLAEAGAEMALAALQDDNTFRAPYPFTRNFAHGSVQTIVVDYANTVKIEATATVGTAEETVILLATIGTGAPDLEHAVFSDTNVNILCGTIHGDVATNTTAAGGVEFGWGGEVDGNLFIGFGGNPDSVISLPPWSSSGNFITGEIVEPLSEIPPFPLPDFPVFPNLPPKGYLIVGPCPNQYGSITSDGFYSKIEIKWGGVLTIDIPEGEVRRIRVTDLFVGSDGIILPGNGKLHLYVDNILDLTQWSEINKDGDINSLFLFYRGSNKVVIKGGTEFVGSIYTKESGIKISGGAKITGNVLSGGSSDVKVTGGAEVLGAIYAPDAHITVDGGGVIEGAVVAREFTVKGGSNVTFQSVDLGTFPGFAGGGQTIPSIEWVRP
ncbi:PilX N-terminal domain-containing pilus assembly protein [candidate division NPL-UPA2 bacterium]|nr:PilX N-terminal domain-containing pilus assembly protein [candidate division NPL-UPA2 bacterium]